MKRRSVLIAILLVICLFLQVPGSAWYYFDYPLDIYEYVNVYVPWYYYKEYLNASASNFAEAKERCAEEFSEFLVYDDASNLYTKPEEDYTMPWSNGPEASDRTIYIQHNHKYRSMALFRNESKEATSWTWYYLCDETPRTTEYYLKWNGWAGHSMEYDMYFKYPGLVLMQITGETTGDVANVLIVVS